MLISLLRWLELLVAVLGLVFLSSSHQINPLLVFAFVVALIYLIILIICLCIGRELFGPRAQTAIEIVAALLLLTLAIYCTMSSDKETLFILALVCGYILPAMLFITAYSGH